MSSPSTECSIIDKIRGPKIAKMSIFDWVTSLLGAWIVGKYILRLSGSIYWLLWIILWIIFGVVAHVMTKVPTMLGFYLGLNEIPIQKSCKFNE
jgi:hypothetical protein